MDSRDSSALSTRTEGKRQRSDANSEFESISEGAYNVSSRHNKHDHHSILDDPVRRLFIVIEHEHTYHEEREVDALGSVRRRCKRF